MIAISLLNCLGELYLSCVDFRDSVVFFRAISSLQMPFSDTDRVSVGILGLSKAVSGAEDMLLSDEGSATDVSISSEAKGDLPGEFAVAGINTIDDTATSSLFSARLKSRGGGDQDEEQANNLHRDFGDCF